LRAKKSTKNKKCKPLRSYFIIVGQWVTGSYLPIDPLTHFHLCGILSRGVSHREGDQAGGPTG